MLWRRKTSSFPHWELNPGCPVHSHCCPSSSANVILCLCRTSKFEMFHRSVHNVCSCYTRTGYKNTSIELAWDCHSQSPIVQKIVSSEQKFTAWYKTMQMAIHSTILYSLQTSPSKRGRWCIGKCSEILNHIEIRSQWTDVSFTQYLYPPSIIHFHF